MPDEENSNKIAHTQTPDWEAAQATERQISAAREFYKGGGRVGVTEWAEYAGKLDRIIDDLLGRTNPYFGD